MRNELSLRLFDYGNVWHYLVADDVEEELCGSLLGYVLHPMGVAHQLLFESDYWTCHKGRVVTQVELGHEGDVLGFFHRSKSFVRVADDALDVELI